MKFIKKMFYSLSTSMLVAPVTVMAQFREPSGTNLPGGSILNIITNLMYWLLFLVGIIAVIGFVISGILYLTAAGDETRMESAKKALIYSIIGVIVALLGLIILRAVSAWLSGSSTSF